MYHLDFILKLAERIISDPPNNAKTIDIMIYVCMHDICELCCNIA